MCESTVKNLTRRVKHVLNNFVDYKVPYGRGVVYNGICVVLSRFPGVLA